MAKDEKEKIEFTKEDLERLVDELAEELGSISKSDASLEKGVKEDSPAEDSEGEEAAAPDMDSVGDKESATPEPGAPGPADEDKPAVTEEAPAEEVGEPHSELEEEAEVAPEGSPEHEAGEIEPDDTVEGLQAKYAQLGEMDPEALKMHYAACKQAMLAYMAPELPVMPDAAPEAPAPEVAAPQAPEMSPEMAMKSEKLVSSLKKSEEKYQESETKLKKYETELADMKAKFEKQEEVMLELAEKLAAPIRKSVKEISELSYVAKSEESAKVLTPGEIKEKLMRKAATNLSKSDRDLINGYYCGGVTVNEIKHLLVESK